MQGGGHGAAYDVAPGKGQAFLFLQNTACPHAWPSIMHAHMNLLTRTITILACATATTLPALEFHLDGYVGQLTGDQELDPLDKRTEFGVLADGRLPFMPVSVGANGFWSEKKEDGTTLTSREVQLGLVKIFDPLVLVHPFIGGGVSWADLSLETANLPSHDGNGVGGWVAGGVHVTFALFDVGVMAGWSRILVDVDNAKYDAGGTRVGAFIGLGF